MAIDISVVVNGGERFLNLPADFNASFEYKSGLFSNESMPGSFAMGMRIPVEGNSEILGLAHKIEVGNREYLYDARYYKNGALKHVGKILVEQGMMGRDKKELDTSFLVFSYGSISEGVTIREVISEQMDLGTSPSDIADEAGALNLLPYPDAAICFPSLKCEGFYGSGDYSPEIFNVWDQTSQSFKTNTTSATKFSLLPQVYLLHVLEKCFSYFGFSISGDVMNDSRFMKIHLIGLHAIDKINGFESLEAAKTSTTAIPTTIFTPISFDEIIKDTTADGITLPASTFYPLVSGAYYIFYVKLIISPAPGGGTLTSQFIGQSTQQNTGITGGQEEVIISNSFTADSTQSSGFEIYWAGAGFDVLEGSTILVFNADNGSNYLNNWQGQFDLGDCVPDISVGEFLKICKKVLGCTIKHNSITKIVDISLSKNKLTEQGEKMEFWAADFEKEVFEGKKYILKWGNDVDEYPAVLDGEVGAFSDLPTARPGFAYLVKNTNQIAVADYTGFFLFDWKLIGLDLKKVSIGSGKEVVISLGAKLPEVAEINDGTDDFLGPSISESGSSEWIEQGKKTWPVYLSIFHGLEAGEVGDYPLSSPFNYNYEGDDILSFSLNLDEEDIGVFDLLLKPWYEFRINSVRIKRKIDIGPMNPEELIDKVLIIENQKFIVEQISIKDSLKGKSIASLYLRKFNVD